MTKTLKKVLLSVTAFLMVLSVGLAINVSVAKTVKAEDTLVVTNVQQVHIEAYNSAADGLGQRSEYIISFNKNIFDDAVEVGTEVSTREDIAAMLGSVKVNNVVMSSHVGNAFKAYKFNNNTIKVSNNRPMLYAEFLFPAGLTLNGFTTASEVTWYENSDWTFDTTADDYMIKGVYEAPDGSQSNAAYVCIFTNRADAVDNKAQLSKILINGKQLFSDEGVADTSLVVDDWWNDWDSGSSQYQFRIKISFTELDGGLSEITFKEGFSAGSYTLSKDQTFVRPLAESIGNTGWASVPTWVEKGNEFTLEKIEQTGWDGYNHNSNYTVKFNYASDLFEAYNVGDDMTDWLNSRASTFYDNAKFNDVHFATFHSNKKAIITKLDVNTININLNYATITPAFTLLPALRINGTRMAEKVTYYGNSQGEYVKLDTAPALEVLGVVPIATNSSTATSMRVVFNVPAPTNSSSQSNIANLDQILINGVPFSESGATIISANGETVVNRTTYNMSVPYSMMEAPLVFTFTDDWDINGVKLAEDQLFVADRIDFNKWADLPQFTQVMAKTITYKQGDEAISTASAKTLTLPAITDIIADYGKTFIGWTDGTNLYKAGEDLGIVTEDKTFTAVELDYKALGAQIRLFGSAGIRFGFSVDKVAYDSYVNAGFITEIGTLIARTETITDLTYVEGDENVLVIKSTINDSTDDIIEFKAGIYNMYEHNFDVSLTARSYIKVQYTNDSTVSYIYSDSLVKTVSVLANEIIEGIEAGTITDASYMTEEAQKLLNAYAGK